MRLKTLTRWVFLVPLFIIVVPPAAWAEKKAEKKEEKGSENDSSASAVPNEITCSADVVFTWKRTPPQQLQINEQGKQTTVTPDPSVLSPIEEHYTRVSETGYVEEELKNRVAMKVPPAAILARRACEELHQEESSCISRKLRTNQSDLQLLDYGSRTALRKSIERDCAANKGICLEIKSTPVVCLETIRVKVGEENAAVEGGAAPKEDEKKKGAKK